MHVNPELDSTYLLDLVDEFLAGLPGIRMGSPT
jgi:hypothetical protein